MATEYSAGFILEAQLEAFLAGNWKSIRWGRTDALVVVELKRGRPSDMVVGQIARYIGYVRSHLAMPGQAVEGLIVAREADDALRYAVAAFPGLQLMTYEVTFELNLVD